jgi:DNA-binding transcriptional ArsR family regulator
LTSAPYLTYRLFNRIDKYKNSQMDRLSDTFSALADPTRRAILARLALGETSVSELSKPFDISGPAISRHLKVLEKAGLITRGREAQWRPCKIEPQALKSVDEWLERYRQFWEERLDRLDDYLRKLQGKEEKKRRKERKNVGKK